MSYVCEIKDLPALPSVFIRTRTSIADLPQRMGQLFGEIARYLGELGQQPAGPPYVAYYNMDMEDLDVEIGFPVAQALPTRGRIENGEIPGGKMATCMHTGPYHEIKEAYTALNQWLQENPYEPTGVAYEMYLNDPAETPPEQLLTQIGFPISSN